MRRKDREITDANAIEACIKGEQILHVAFYDEGDIYIVPVNYGYTCENGQYVFYFHGAKAGRKYELTQASPTVGFEIDGKYQLLEGDIACEYSAHFLSVIGTGKLSLTEDRGTKIKGLNAIMQQTTGNAVWSYEDKMLEAVAVFRLDVEKISCKGK